MDPNQSVLLDGRYDILRKLDEGGMGTIYQVRHVLLDEIRVAKVMRPQAAEDADLKRRFLREARLAIRVRHPNIAQLYDYSVDEQGTAVMVMEFIDGVTLRDVIRSGPPPSVGIACELAAQALDALACLHAHGIIHRDVSSDNVMLALGIDGRPLAKLIDLGIAKAAMGEGTLTEAGAFVGKARYSAPEQFSSGPLGPSTDIYSFGVVLYELLTGRVPFEGSSFADLAGGHLFKAPLAFAKSDPEGRIPSSLRELVLQALHKQPEERVPSAEAFAARLGSHRSGGEPEEAASLLARARREAGAPPVASRRERPVEPGHPTDAGIPSAIDDVALLIAEPLSVSEIDILDALHPPPPRRADPVREAVTPLPPRPLRRPAPLARSVPVPSRLVPRAAWLVMVLVIAAIAVTVYLFVTAPGPDLYADRIGAVTALPENTAAALTQKLQAVAALLVLLPPEDARRDSLIEMRERLASVEGLLNFVDRLERLRDDVRDGTADVARVDADAPKLWRFMRQYRARFAATDPAAIELEEKARRTLREIADDADSASLHELADRP